MFNVGGGELIAILLIALIVLGPKRLPEAARQIGKTMGDLRRLSTSFQNEVRTALDTADDPNEAASRRGLVTKDDPVPPPPEAAGSSRSVRQTPLVAAPDPAVTRAAPKRAPTKAASTKKKAATPKPKNGTAVKKPAASKATSRRTKT